MFIMFVNEIFDGFVSFSIEFFSFFDFVGNNLYLNIFLDNFLENIRYLIGMKLYI